ncbi:hypothetical protein KIW84_046407 [Lathyrus oleraceus]|uniref:Uncharacterized protein n=1 Tax=Pisum sativum TaxID=3888 RepID=A0A9D4XN42_PEA|nr:hypothetical protein KIW84_046407 [Pisum sativum]
MLKQEERVIQPLEGDARLLFQAPRSERKEIEAASEASREQNGSLVEGVCGYFHLVMSGYAKVEYRCRCAQATMERRLSSREAERQCLYRRAMVTLFHDMIHHETECYVDDMIAKSQTGEGHLVDLAKSFDRLRQFKLRLNSDQCTIRVRSGKTLGFIVREESRATPFSLVYGMEAVLPVEVQIPSLRVLMDVKLQEAEWVRTRYEELSLIEEKRLAAICHGQLYQQRMKRAFDKKVRPRVYHVGDMVLKRILPPQNDRRGKWIPNYEGPFVVKKVFSGGALLLTTMDGEDFPSPVNADTVKKILRIKRPAGRKEQNSPDKNGHPGEPKTERKGSGKN